MNLETQLNYNENPFNNKILDIYLIYQIAYQLYALI